MDNTLPPTGSLLVVCVARLAAGRRGVVVKLYVATLTCKQFATPVRPTRPVAIVAGSYDEALGKAIGQAREIWRGRDYSEHNADIAEVPEELIDQVCA